MNLLAAPRLVIASGCFLFLHDGHKELLQQAASLVRPFEDQLLVCVNSTGYVTDKYLSLWNALDAKQRDQFHRWSSLFADMNRVKQVHAYLDVLLTSTGVIAQVICTDNYFADRKLGLLPELSWPFQREPLKVWVLGSDYADLHFKERDHVDQIVITKRNHPTPSSDLLTLAISGDPAAIRQLDEMVERLDKGD